MLCNTVSLTSANIDFRVTGNNFLAFSIFSSNNSDPQ